MSDFCGKTYKYKDKVIGVCKYPVDGGFMVGHIGRDEVVREKMFPLFRSIEAAQGALDMFAISQRLIDCEQSG